MKKIILNKASSIINKLKKDNITRYIDCNLIYFLQ